MKYTLCITQRCNLRCGYCYMGKKDCVMDLRTAAGIVDFAFRQTPQDEQLDFGFFGGEPLLEFELIQAITNLIEAHPAFDPDRVLLTLVTNGTIFSDEIVNFLKTHSIVFALSCDGSPGVQDVFRRFPDGRGSSAIVERTVHQAIQHFPEMPVNAVYHPATLRHLPETVAYFLELGLARIYLNPDFSAPWRPADAAMLADVYGALATLYVNAYREEAPFFLSVLDCKIAVILRGGYRPNERCRMGKGEFAFTPGGRVYPCERLIGEDTGERSIGQIGQVGTFLACSPGASSAGGRNDECKACGLAEYCMNWCGCSNYFSSGSYDKVGPFLCASERSSIETAFQVLQTLEAELGPTFTEHVSGMYGTRGRRRPEPQK